MFKKQLSFVLAVLMLAGVFCDAGIVANAATTTVYTQDFNSMSDNNFPSGWKAGVGSAARTVDSYAGAALTAVTRNASTGSPFSSTSGYGVYKIAIPDGDNSIGFITSSNASSGKGYNLYYQYTNATGAAIDSLSMNYDIEKFRKGKAAYSINFYYSTNGTAWTQVSAGTSSWPADTDNDALSPPASISYANLPVPVSLANGSSIYFAWNFSPTTGTTFTNAQALAVDNVKLDAITSSGTTAVTGVTLDKTTASLLSGSTVSLTATVAPIDATNKNVSWSSSNTAVATVSDGVVTGVSAGTATITVTTADGGKTASCIVTVTASTGGTYSQVGSTINFEDASKSSYAAGNVTTCGFSLNLYNTLVGMLAGDVSTDNKSARMMAYSTGSGADTSSPAYITTNDILSNITKITFKSKLYGTDSGVTAILQYSADNTTWTDLGTAISPTSTLTEYSVPSDTPITGYFRVKCDGTAAKRLNIDDLQFFTTISVNQVVAPSFDPPSGELDEGATISISSATEGASIAYSVYDGTDTTATPIAAGSYSAAIDPFAGASGTTVTVTAQAAKAGMTASNLTTVTYTRPNIKTIAEIRAISPVDNKVVSNVTTTGVLAYINGQYNYVQASDGSAGIVLYGTYSNLVVGDVIKIRGDVVLYSGMYEFSGASATKLSTVTAPTPAVVTVDELRAGKYQGMYVRLENVVVGETSGTSPNTSTIIRQGSSEMVIFKMPVTAADGTDIITGDTINVNAGVSFHTSAVELTGGAQLLTDSANIVKAQGVLAPPYVSSNTTLSANELATLACSTQSALIYYTIYEKDEDTGEMTDLTGELAYAGGFDPFEYVGDETDSVIVHMYSKSGTQLSNTVEVTFYKLILTNIAYTRTLTNGTPVIVKGMVSRKDGNTYYMQDVTGGIAVYTSSTINVGDEIQIKGTLGFRYGAVQIVPDATDGITVVSSSNVVEPTTVTVQELLDKKYQGMLIKLVGVTVGTQNGDYLPFTDANGIIVNAYTKYNQIANVAAGDKVNVIAAVSIYDYNASTYFGGTPQLIVTDAANNVTKINDSITIEGMGLYSGSQLLTGFTIGAAQTVKATVSNYSADIDTQTAVLTAAFYDSGKRLIYTAFTEKASIAKGSSATLSVAITIPNGAASMKILLLDSLQTIKPICPAVTLGEYVAPQSTLEVSFIDVGQGDAMLIRSDNQTMLIDAGPSASTGNTVLSYLQSQNITKLDYIVASHGHSDHVGGLPTVIGNSNITIDKVLVSPKPFSSVPYNAFLTAVANKQKTITTVTRGDTFTLGGATVLVLSAKNTGSSDESESVNQSSVVLKITLGDKSFIFAGDCETPVDTEALSYWGESVLNADVLKVAHHGSNDSSAQSFVNAISPQYSVIEVGAGNSYGHPQAAAVARLQAVSGNTILRTDLNGTIKMMTNGTGAITVAVSKGSVSTAELNEQNQAA